MTLGATLDWGNDMGSLISPGPARHRRRPRRRRRRQGRAGADRRTGPPRSRPVLLRADDPRGRHARDDLLRARDLRPGDRGVPLPRRGRRGLPRQRRRLRPQRLDLQPGRAARPGDRPRRSSAARSTSTRPSPPPSAASTPRWAACASPGSAAARAARASCATPRRSRSRPSGWCGSRRRSGMSDETYAQGDDGQPAPAEEAGARMSVSTSSTPVRLRRPRHRVRLRRLGHRAAADREGLPGRRDRGRRPLRGRATSPTRRSTSSSSSSGPRSAATASSASTRSRTA